MARTKKRSAHAHRIADRKGGTCRYRVVDDTGATYGGGGYPFAATREAAALAKRVAHGVGAVYVEQHCAIYRVPSKRQGLRTVSRRWSCTPRNCRLVSGSRTERKLPFR